MKIKIIENPDIDIDVITDEGPGIGIMEIFSSIHFFISIFPGSEIVGVPASEIKDTICPFFKISIISI